MPRLISYIFYTVLLMLPLTGLQAQELKWSNPQKLGERNVLTEVVGQNGHGIYIIRRSYRQTKHNVTLDHYSNEMRLLESKSLFSDKDQYYIDARLLDNKLFVFFAEYEKDGNIFEVRARQYAPNLAQVIKDTLLFTMNGDDFDKRLLRMEKPKNQNNILFLYTRQTSEIPSLFNYLVLDSALNRLHSGDFNLNIVNEYEIETIAFTNNALALQIREDVKKKINKAGYQFTIASGRFGDNFLRQFNLYNDTFSVTEGVIKADYVNSSFVFGGFYNKKDSMYAKGYCLWRQNFNGGNPVFYAKPFPYRAVAEMAGKNARIQGLYRLRVGDLILRKDGGVVLMGEEYEESREAVMDMNMYGMSQSNFRYYYYYENVLVLSVNTDGSLDWHSVLRKEQVSVNDNGIYSSYVVSAMPDKLVYVYNDLSRKNWNLSLYEVRADGISKNRIVLRAQDYDARLIPQQAALISYNELIVPAIGNKGFMLLKLKL